jgi:hypothetical protein
MIDEVPFFTGRSVLLFEEGHQIFHRDFLVEMRRRMQALIAVYAATDAGPLAALQRDFNVTHLLVDRRHLQKHPAYFAPFEVEVAALRSSRAGKQLFLTEAVEKAGVIRVGEMVLVDLARITQPEQTVH